MRRNYPAGLEHFATRLVGAGVIGELWVDGSFVTEKLDPEDVDVALAMSATAYDTGTPALQTAIEEISSRHHETKAAMKCDGFVFFEWPHGHALAPIGARSRAYWLRTFGSSRSNDPKGIAVVAVG